MDLVADILLTAGAFGAAFYCYVLSRRLSRLATLEGGVGGAIAVLSAQVDDMTRVLEQANAAATLSSRSLENLTERAEKTAARLELLLASLHDLPAKEDMETQDPEDQNGPGRGERKMRFVRRRVSGDNEEAA